MHLVPDLSYNGEAQQPHPQRLTCAAHGADRLKDFVPSTKKERKNESGKKERKNKQWHHQRC